MASIIIKLNLTKVRIKYNMIQFIFIVTKIYNQQNIGLHLILKF